MSNGSYPNARDMRSSWLTKEDLNPPQTLVIADIQKRTVGREEPEEKWCLFFKGTTRGLTLNGTNIDTLTEMFGDASAKWIGRAVELFVDPNVEFGGKKPGGIRIRKPDEEVGKYAEMHYAETEAESTEDNPAF